MTSSDEEISIPVEAIEYIENKLSSLGYDDPFKFEIIELFFHWFATQDLEKQKEVLRKAMEYGRRGMCLIEFYKR
jgi:hypothetical protein